MARTHIRQDQKNRADFFAEGKRLDAAGDERANCWLRKQRVDYDVEPNSAPDSHNLDHYLAVATHPEFQSDPDNWRHSHALCNGKRGKGALSLDLGTEVPAWY